jgi:hypothetical protein
MADISYDHFVHVGVAKILLVSSVASASGGARGETDLRGAQQQGEIVMRAVHTRPLEKPRVSIVVPARNEARNLEVVLPTLPADAEIIVVDGHSVDGSAEVVARVRPDARFVQQTRRGKGNALVVGFAEATGDIIVMFDADGSADATEIDRFVQVLVNGADFAKGSRVLPGGGSADITPIRDWGNR